VICKKSLKIIAIYKLADRNDITITWISNENQIRYVSSNIIL